MAKGIALSPNSDLGNTDLVLLAMAMAGAGDDFIDVEEIAEQAYALSRTRFGWRTRDYPSDKTVVQAIADLEAKHSRDQFTRRGVRDQADRVATRRLTVEGRERALRVAERYAARTFPDLVSAVSYLHGREPDAPEPTPADKRRAQSELTELRRHPAYRAWADGDDLSEVERWQVLDSLNCLPDAPADTISGQTEHLAGLAERWKDAEVSDFLQAVRAALSTRANT